MRLKSCKLVASKCIAHGAGKQPEALRELVVALGLVVRSLCSEGSKGSKAKAENS